MSAPDGNQTNRTDESVDCLATATHSIKTCPIPPAWRYSANRLGKVSWL